MADAHERYEELAVGHVLGGLRSRDASMFRAHLAGCRTCRMRVAELRGIAADLAAAERDELAGRISVATDVAEHDNGGDPEGSWSRRRIGRGSLLIASAVVLAVAAFWLYHVQRVNAQLEGVVWAQSEALDLLATGRQLAPEVEEGVVAVAAERDGRLAVSLAELPAVPSDAVLVAWRLVDGEVREMTPVAFAPVLTSGAVVPFVIEVGEGITDVVVTVETRGQWPNGPGERRLLALDLRR